MAGTVVAPVTWPTGLYELADSARGLAVCVQHRGTHVWYLDGCQGVGGGIVQPIGSFRPCVLHGGRHLYVRGHCINPGGRYGYRYGRCSDDGCGVEVCHRLDIISGRSERLDAETERLHVHAPPVRVELDEGRLAAAIVTASHALREQRQSPVPQANTATAERPRPPARPEPSPADPTPAADPPAVSIPTVTVWSPGPDDGPGT